MENDYGNEKRKVDIREERETEIIRVLRSLNQSVNELDKVQEKLGLRLVSITRNEPSNGGDKASTPEYSTALAQEINKAVNRIDNVVANFHEMIDKIEL